MSDLKELAIIIGDAWASIAGILTAIVILGLPLWLFIGIMVKLLGVECNGD